LLLIPNHTKKLFDTAMRRRTKLQKVYIEMSHSLKDIIVQTLGLSNSTFLFSQNKKTFL